MRFVDDTNSNPSATGNSPVVIAAGLWRCSTSSLQLAFEDYFGLTPCMHGAYIMPHPSRMKLVCRAMDLANQGPQGPNAGPDPGKEERRKIVKDLFGGYLASSDLPGFVLLDDLLDLYPDAKVVLNKRKSKEEWARSFRESLLFFSTWRYICLCWLVPISYTQWMAYQSYSALMKRRFPELMDPFGIEAYERHNEWVREVAREKGKGVLEWEPREGWGPLCRFLGREEPKDEFPRLNDAKEIRKLKVYSIQRGLIAWTMVLAPVIRLL
ncbi:hypothetical protein AOQ84DRAFT_416223 [Glonium stellatum]|uniref:Uncharacterized protein n=1 Tax=Glonium stellatum TaxID=574774 RepID=A0A8E2FAC8_9PEZI|nr:hypothetical protein AOQ84DRAFT_416223 [Glonium stellatum]